MTVSPEFTLREMQPADSDALSKLISGTAMGMMTTHFLVDTYTALIQSDEHRTQGVVIEAEGVEGLVGLATVSFGEMQFNGDLLPYALLANLKVREEFRRRGLGARLAAWRVERARAEFGEDGVIITGLMSDNHASRATATRWCREFIEPIRVAIGAVRNRPPASMRGITVREAEDSELAEIAAKQNQFYRDYNLYEPVSAEFLSGILAETINDTPANRYFVAVSEGGEIVAGSRVRNRGLYMVDKIHRLPLPIRLANLALRIVPPDHLLREMQAIGIWYLPGQIKAGQHLWQMMRWLSRDVATSINAGYDPQGPLGEVFQIKPWSMPRITITLAIHGPTDLERSRPCSAGGRR